MTKTTAELAERCSDLTEQLEAARRLNQTMVRQHNTVALAGQVT
jgi:hypothetical protein